MNSKHLFVALATFAIFSCNSNQTKETQEKTLPFQETWESLAKYNEEPEWFKDAKFGIYFHWGVYSVPAFGSEWYPRNMHFPNSREYKHHVETYGQLNEFGYHDFAPMFKAENFDAQQWADLFKRAGARFAGPVAEHHDGFSMWDSDITPWNVMEKGPKRDITGELKEAITANKMKFITTFHHARNLQRYKDSINEKNFNNSHYPLFEGTAQTKDDEELNYLYGNIPEEQWLEEIWFGKLKEVIDKYNPDIVWFDSWLDEIPEDYRKKFCAYYLNEAAKSNKEVVIVRKQDDLPLDVSVDDLEKSRKNKMGEKTWMTDETVSKGSWCYTNDLEIKSSADIIHTLIDIVSKNGVLLLNISPKADGTIPEDQKTVLLEIGERLDKNGRAIYETRPWYTFGEGPTKEPEGHFKNHAEFLKIKYSAKDIRYTASKDEKTIFCSILGVPLKSDKIELTAFAKDNINSEIEIKEIKLPGNEKKINWQYNDSGIEIISPEFDTDEKAVVFEVVLK